MARKDLLKGLMSGVQNPPSDPPAPAPSVPAKGAIGAVSRSVADLKSRAVIDVDPRMVDQAGITDRLDQPELDALIDSMRDYGQQVPVLLRTNPNDPERYQVVYGRRRIAAAVALGIKVKALVRSLNDHDLVVVQGQENTARKDLSFIEKANFARQMRDTGYDRKVICDTLNVDKTVISRMLQVADAVPLNLIEAIGAAPLAGRDRWLALSKGLTPDADMLGHAVGDTSDDRFQAVMAAVQAKPTAPPRAKPPAPRQVTHGDDKIAQVKGAAITLADPEFADWLSGRLTELYRDWKSHGKD